MQKFYVIGLSDSRHQYFVPEVVSLIAKGKIFSGGKRHHEIVASLLPEQATWIDITVPLSDVFLQYRNHQEIIVFASGDPLFYGFANTIRRELPEAEIRLLPTFNSLQTLAHRLLIPYQQMRNVSLTGRDWDVFDEALIRGESLIGALTDREKTPATIAARMLEFGYNNYHIYIGEALGNDEEENIYSMTLEEASKSKFNFPNCLLLKKTCLRKHPFGIPEKDFNLLNGRSKMITKMPIRLTSLSMLELSDKHSFWDIGFCTGSVSIEAKLQFPFLKVTSFERRAECAELMKQNCRKFGSPGITPVIGDFLTADISKLPAPDAIFIGGHGGQLAEMMQRIDQVLLPGGVIVFNSVSNESQKLFCESIQKIHRQVTNCVHIAVDQFNPIEIIQAK